MAAAGLLWQTTKTIVTAPWRWGHNALTLVIGNPVISREMKVRMRFARAFRLQGAYLLFLIVTVLFAYQGVLAHTPLRHPAELQERLQLFYFVLLYSLVGITVLVAPGLAAGAIAFERERRTLDLLLTSPLRPMQILVGKLIASFAFLLLLLVESMPVVAVCIIMGGATVEDFLATYELVALSLLHLCAFAIYCSACNRSSGAAIFWAYLGTFVLLGLTVWMAVPDVALTAAHTFGPPSLTGSLSTYVMFPLSAVHPFAAPILMALPTRFLGLEIPCWLFGAVVSLLLTRFWLTAAAAKLPALYRANFTGSLRRQALLLFAIVALTLPTVIHATFVGGTINRDDFTVILVLLVEGGSALAIALFVPWIATYGEQHEKKTANDGWFRPWRMFQPKASGALPFLLLWYGYLVALFAGVLVWQLKVQPFWNIVAIGAGYCALVLTFLWVIGRFWSATVRQLSLARWLSLATMALLAILPSLSKWSLAYPFIAMATIETYQMQEVLKVFVEQAKTHSPAIAVITLVLALITFCQERKRKA